MEGRVEEIRSGGATVPFGFEALRAAAREALPDRLFRHVRATPGSGSTAAANRGFDAWAIVPRTFRDVSDCTLGTELFGEQLPSPVMLAPIGRQAVYHPAGETATARAAGRLSVPFALSTVAARSIESVADTMGASPRVFQLYWPQDWEVAASLLERAEEAGYRGILLTVDFQGRRWVPEDVIDEAAPEFGAPLANFRSDPVADYPPDGTGDPPWDRTASWEDLSALQDRTDLPIYLKGIVHPDDAARAVDHGADGIVVSNHGARQADGAIGAIRALPAVVEAVDGRCPVLFDSGIRHAADAFKALALGADGVFLGRPYLYGLIVNGETGVYETVHNFLAALESLVGMAGCRGLDEVDRGMLRKRPTNR